MSKSKSKSKSSSLSLNSKNEAEILHYTGVGINDNLSEEPEQSMLNAYDFIDQFPYHINNVLKDIKNKKQNLRDTTKTLKDEDIKYSYKTTDLTVKDANRRFNEFEQFYKAMEIYLKDLKNFYTKNKADMAKINNNMLKFKNEFNNITVVKYRQ